MTATGYALLSALLLVIIGLAYGVLAITGAPGLTTTFCWIVSGLFGTLGLLLVGSVIFDLREKP